MNRSGPGVVFDCTIFLQALANHRGPAFACKRLVDDGRAVLFLSPDVLNRPELRQKLRALTAERAQVFLADVQAKAQMLASVPAVFSFPRDPKDEPYLNLALAAGARYLVAWDKDLLDLMNDSTADGRDFQQRFPALRIVTPVAFLQEVSRQSTAETDTPEPKA